MSSKAAPGPGAEAGMRHPILVPGESSLDQLGAAEQWERQGLLPWPLGKMSGLEKLLGMRWGGDTPMQSGWGRCRVQWGRILDAHGSAGMPRVVQGPGWCGMPKGSAGMARTVLDAQGGAGMPRTVLDAQGGVGFPGWCRDAWGGAGMPGAVQDTRGRRGCPGGAGMPHRRGRLRSAAGCAGVPVGPVGWLLPPPHPGAGSWAVPVP